MYPYATNITELAAYLRFLDRVHFRFMAERIDGEFKVTRLIVGPQAPWKNYEYSDVIFNAGVESGNKVADWLLNSKITSWYNKAFPILLMNSSVDSRVEIQAIHRDISTYSLNRLPCTEFLFCMEYLAEIMSILQKEHHFSLLAGKLSGIYSMT